MTSDEPGAGLDWRALLGPVCLLAIVSARLGTPFVLSAHAHVFVAQELALVIAAAVLAANVARKRLGPARDAITYLSAGLVAAEMAAMLAASDRWLAIRSATVWIAGLVVFVVARALATDARALGLRGTVLPLGVVAISVLAEALGLVRLSASHHAPGGLLGERNVAAELLVVGAPLAVHVVLEGARRERMIALGVVALSAAALVLTRTRSAWLAGLSCIALLGVNAWRGRGSETGGRVWQGGAAVALGILLVLALPTKLRWRGAHPYYGTLTRLVDRTTPSAHGRLVQYATTARMVAAHPLLGVGPGNWAPQYLSFAEPNDPTVHPALAPVNRLPNSDIVGFAAERGLPAFALLVGLAVLLVRQRGASPALGRLRNATLLAVAIVASLDAVLQTPAALFLVAWVLGLTTPAGDTQTEKDPMGWRVVFVVAGAVLSVAAVPAGMRARSLGLAAHARGSDDLERATRLDPGDVALRLFTAESWIADGECDRARPHLDAVAKFSPASPARAELAARCAPAR